MTKEFIAEEFRSLQQRICNRLEQLDGKSTFKSDKWKREEGGGGKTNTIVSGDLIEKGGVAFSEVFGPVTEGMKLQMGIAGETFFATGVSIVLHPKSPHVPIIHMNVRYFELNTGECWFGGGIDLTPHYIDLGRAKTFHQGLKNICDEFHPSFYEQFKPWADRYFYLPHRNETRGVGGVFFDHEKPDTRLSKEALLKFCLRLGDAFASLYAEQVEGKRNESVTSNQLAWRNIRRGRYVEFNLVHDRGTKFGLVSGGRTESILMSMPPDASWEYMFSVDDASEEGKTLAMLKQGIDWLTIVN